MARTGVRPAARPRKSRKPSRSRPGVGRRQRPFPLTAYLAWLCRIETLGLLIVLIALGIGLSPFLGMGKLGPLTSISRTLGLQFFVLAGLIADAGILIWRRQERSLVRHPRLLLALAL